jgi:Flp pilus assembly protein TadG
LCEYIYLCIEIFYCLHPIELVLTSIWRPHDDKRKIQCINGSHENRIEVSKKAWTQLRPDTYWRLIKKFSDEGYKMKISKFWKNQSGAAAVEMAIIAPVLILLAVGSFEFGLLLYNKQVITNAGREAARAGIVREGSNFLEDSDLKAIVINYCDDRLIDFGGNKTPAEEDIVLDPSTKSARAAADFGDDFSVKITYGHKLAVPSLFRLNSTISISAFALMKMEQMP